MTTAVLFVLFAAGSFAFRDHFARKHKRREAEEAVGAKGSSHDDERADTASAMASPGRPLRPGVPPGPQ